MDNWTDYRRLIYKSRYARWNEELGRRENWDETVKRYCDFFKNREGGEHFPYEEVYNAIYNMEVMPSMRALMTAGPALERDNIAGYNCSFIPIDSLRTFDEIMYILMCGTGVGFSVEEKYVSQLPVVAETFTKSGTTIVVPDSRTGWASSLRELVSLLYSGRIPEIDYSRVRPAGARLKTFGGRASGPEPLQRLYSYTCSLISGARGRKLTTLECHDLACKIADVVIVGGVRRSALISLSDLGDTRLQSAKNGSWWDLEPQRALANNSAVYNEKPAMEAFLNEWSNLYGSKSGERGIFNQVASRKQVIKSGRRDPNHVFGTNPCLTGDTVIATLDGPKTFKELAETENDVLVYAWHPSSKLPVVRWMRRPHCTKTNAEVLEIEFDSGLKVKATPDHSFYSFRGKKVKAKDLRVGQSVRAWSMSKHPNGHLRVHAWDAETNSSCHQWVHRMVYDNSFGKIPDGFIIHHKDENVENNSPDNLEMMTQYEHNVVHYPKRFANGFDGTCPNHKVVSVKQAGNEDVFNGCVDDAHSYIVVDPTPVAGVMSGIVSANCGEIILRPNGLCNLSEVIVRPKDSLDDLRRKVRIASIIGTFQSTLTDFRYVRKVWRTNAEEERLLGVSFTGIFDNHQTLGKLPFYDSTLDKNSNPHIPLEKALEVLRDVAIETNKDFAGRIGINASAAITCVKPSGTVSQLVGCSSGIHPSFSPYYYRTVRLDNKDPLCSFLKDQGLKNEPEKFHPDSQTVFYFPTKSHGVPASQVGAMEHLRLYKAYRTHWCEHNPSVTIYYKDSEFLEIGNWIWNNWDDIGGIAFLPHSDHVYEQAPYIELTEAEYVKALEEAREIDWAKFEEYEKEDATTNSHDLACSAGICEIL